MPFPADVVIRAVDANDGEHECRIATAVEGRECQIAASVDGGDPLTGSAGDFFEALRVVRRALDENGLRLCCGGARRDAWASGMQRDMALGRSCYVVSMPRTKQLAAVVGVLDPAPLDTIGTVADQDQFHREWLASSTDD